MSFTKILIAFVFILCFIAVSGAGYIDNIRKLTQEDFQEPYRAEVLRAVGVVVIPMGAILGYMHLDGDCPCTHSTTDLK